MQGVRRRCFICSALKRAVLANGKLNKLEGIEGLETTGGVDGFISKYSRRQGTGDTIGLTFRLITHHAVRIQLITERHMLIRPWNGKELYPCNDISGGVCATPLLTQFLISKDQRNSLNRSG